MSCAPQVRHRPHCSSGVCVSGTRARLAFSILWKRGAISDRQTERNRGTYFLKTQNQNEFYYQKSSNGNSWGVPAPQPNPPALLAFRGGQVCEDPAQIFDRP